MAQLKIVNGDRVDLMNETAKKTCTVTVNADTMVGRDEIRVSEEDLKSLGLNEGEEVSIKKSIGITEKVSTGAKKAGAAVGKAAGDTAKAVKIKVKGKDDLKSS
jgi:hypothetical protein